MKGKTGKQALTATELLIAAQAVLTDAGYRLIPTASRRRDNACLMDNFYNIVTIAAFETWSDLAESWSEYQSGMVETMSHSLSKTDPKAWDGYLVLLTPSPVPQQQLVSASELRKNTSRLRKLLGTGDEIRSLVDVRKVLLPLIPISASLDVTASPSGLDALPRILEKRGIDPDAVKVIIDAFKSKSPIMQSLHKYRITK